MTMPEIRVPTQAEPAPAPMDMDGTMPKSVCQADMDRTVPEIPRAPGAFIPISPVRELYQMEMQTPQQSSAMAEGFTMMSFVQPDRSVPDPFEDRNSQGFGW
jgi:hypothetical protein